MQEFELSKTQEQELLNEGFTVFPRFFSVETCLQFRSLYPRDECFRSTIQMERYRFGQGEYRYFSYPLVKELQEARVGLYRGLYSVANQYMEKFNDDLSFPPTLDDFLSRCHEQGQLLPTLLLLKYGEGGFNTLHQDLYGEVYFPFQVIVLLSKPCEEFDGGELIITEQIPRAQSKASVVPMDIGDLAIISTKYRPVKSSKGYYRANLKHGVSMVKKGTRYTMGFIFHDAK